MSKQKFELGQTVMTRGIADAMEGSFTFRVFVVNSMKRYMQCDWGEMSEDDKELNDAALKKGDDRIFAAYTQPETDTKIWIITEWDRSVTTILFPDEY